MALGKLTSSGLVRARGTPKPTPPSGTKAIVVPPGKMGINVRFSEATGAEITSIKPTSPFFKMAKVGDKIATIDGRPVTKGEELQAGSERERRVVIERRGGIDGRPLPAIDEGEVEDPPTAVVDDDRGDESSWRDAILESRSDDSDGGESKGTRYSVASQVSRSGLSISSGSSRRSRNKPKRDAPAFKDWCSLSKDKDSAPRSARLKIIEEEIASSTHALEEAARHHREKAKAIEDEIQRKTREFEEATRLHQQRERELAALMADAARMASLDDAEATLHDIARHELQRKLKEKEDELALKTKTLEEATARKRAQEKKALERMAKAARAQLRLGEDIHRKMGAIEVAEALALRPELANGDGEEDEGKKKGLLPRILSKKEPEKEAPSEEEAPSENSPSEKDPPAKEDDPDSAPQTVQLREVAAWQRQKEEEIRELMAEVRRLKGQKEEDGSETTPKTTNKRDAETEGTAKGAAAQEESSETTPKTTNNARRGSEAETEGTAEGASTQKGKGKGSVTQEGKVKGATPQKGQAKDADASSQASLAKAKGAAARALAKAKAAAAQKGKAKGAAARAVTIDADASSHATPASEELTQGSPHVKFDLDRNEEIRHSSDFAHFVAEPRRPGWLEVMLTSLGCIGTEPAAVEEEAESIAYREPPHDPDNSLCESWAVDDASRRTGEDSMASSEDDNNLTDAESLSWETISTDMSWVPENIMGMMPQWKKEGAAAPAAEADAKEETGGEPISEAIPYDPAMHEALLRGSNVGMTKQRSGLFKTFKKASEKNAGAKKAGKQKMARVASFGRKRSQKEAQMSEIYSLKSC